jgi:ribosomal protein L2
MFWKKKTKWDDIDKEMVLIKFLVTEMNYHPESAAVIAHIAKQDGSLTKAVFEWNNLKESQKNEMDTLDRKRA